MTDMNNKPAQQPEIPVDTRRIPVFKLIPYAIVLKHMESFEVHAVERCNFTFRNGWSTLVGGKGRTYVETHDELEHLTEYKGVDILSAHYYSTKDTIVLTEEQWKDYDTIRQQ